MKEDYSVDFFLNFFGAIPEDKWCVGKLGGEGGQCCAYGHLNVARHGHWGWAYNDENYAGLARALDRVLRVYKSGGAAINNGYNPRYQQPTPKARILAALHDIKQLQQEQAQEKNLRQVGVESRHAALGDTSRERAGEVERTTLGVVTSDSPPSDGHLPQSLSPVTSALAKQMPCNPHNYVMGVCLYCCATKPVEKVEVEL